MSELFDDLARTLVSPMPRRRALRLLGMTLTAVAVPGIRATKAYATHDCPAQNAFLCACPNRDLFYKICCPNPTPAARYECRCKAPPDGYAQCFKITNRCEQAGSAQCGSSCCDDANEYCASRPQSLCCKRGENTCEIRAAAGSRGGGRMRCCPGDTPKCCANDKRMSCCDAGDTCCAGQCCKPPMKCSGEICVCPKKTKRCGRDCCKTGKNPEKCCDNKTCCKQTEECCGDGCCDTAGGESCSQGTCCPKGKVNCGGKGTCCDPIDCCNGKCCKGDELCANGTCCPPARAFGSGKNARCCPPSTIPTGIGCCPPAIPDCCLVDGDLTVVCPPGQTCVSGGCRRL